MILSQYADIVKAVSLPAPVQTGEGAAGAACWRDSAGLA